MSEPGEDPAPSSAAAGGATYQPRPAARGPAWWPFVTALVLIGSLVAALVVSSTRAERSDGGPAPTSSPTATPAPSPTASPGSTG